jgi:N-methylhydantoinase B
MKTKAADLAVYDHMYRSIADEMGAGLARTAYSPNIKERRDFSCALFDAEGLLLAQAAHIPVHLGAMPRSVEAARNAFPDLRPGDVVMLNDPFQGGTHLPDITLVSPVFHNERCVGYTATRAHHADVGGMTPGSLPDSRSIYQEGLRIPPVRLVRAGEVDEDILRIVCANSRNPGERRGDMRAQLHAHRIGERRWREMIDRCGPETLMSAHEDLFGYSEACMRAAIRDLAEGVWSAEDGIENAEGTAEEARIRARLRVKDGSAELNFSETDDAVSGSLNAVRAITEAAVYYVFLCWMCKDNPADPPPVNAGCFRPLGIHTRPGSLVDAQRPSAVAGGNVETSQRITDVVLSLLAQAAPGRVPAQSQGTMNNITFGGTDAEGLGFAYYETLAGGSGAGENHPGAPAIQCHMTNTLNTPVEALEFAYPLRVRELTIRRGSGGNGRFTGGDGMIREWEALAAMDVTLLTERRHLAPAGSNGGGNGKPGKQTLWRGEAPLPLPAKGTVSLHAGDRVRLETPGGGGFG